MFQLIDDPHYRITSDAPGRWLFQWQAEQRVNAGAQLELRGYNLKTLVTMQWVAVDCLDSRAELVWRTPESPSFNDISAHNRDYVIGRFKLNQPVHTGDTMQFAITGKPEPFACGTYPISLYVDGQRAEASVTVETYPGPAQKLALIAHPAPQADGTIRVHLQPRDTFGYPTAFEKPVSVQIESEGQSLWQGMVTESAVIALDLPTKKVTRLTAIADDDAKEVSNPVLPTSNDGLIPVFGAIHWHTDISSDGMRFIDQAFEAARDAAGLDFAAPADHTPSESDWQTMVTSCDKYNQDGIFTTIYGWEQSSNAGHVNFYFTDPNHPMNPVHFDYPIKPAEYMDDIPHTGFIAIPHHTNAVSYAIKDDGSHYWTQYPWGQPRDYLRLVEIFQSRGNFEREDPPDGWRATFRNNGASALTALEQGHKIGFVGGTDNHQSWPAKENPGRTEESWIHTGAWVQARTRDAIYEALQNRATWACWDTRAIVRVEINGVMQGGVVQLSEPDQLSARVQIYAEKRLDVAELVTVQDATLPLTLSDSLDMDTQIDLGFVERNTFFYLRARQIDGALIYASPIFVELAAL